MTQQTFSLPFLKAKKRAVKKLVRRQQVRLKVQQNKLTFHHVPLKKINKSQYLFLLQ